MGNNHRSFLHSVYPLSVTKWITITKAFFWFCAFAPPPNSQKLGAPVPLVAIYRLLSARTGTAGYTLPEFAFDIYRLRRSSELVVKDRTLEFTHGKTGTTIAVPRSQGGAELFTALVMRKDAGGV